MDRGKYLEKIIKSRGHTVMSVSRESGVPYTTLKSMIDRNLKNASIDNVLKVCKVLGIKADDLVNPSNYESESGGNMLAAENLTSYGVDNLIPVLGRIAAGEPILAEQNVIGYAPAPPMMKAKNRNLFYLQVKGDSMNREFEDGSYVLVDRDAQVENGQIAAVIVNSDEATVKKVSWNEKYLTLIPMSYDENYHPRVVNLEEEEVKIVGKVIGVYKAY